ncbi:hypothetical protein C8F01DRAFT_1286475 [Mycena amicta]|nr:hypothetical protein C8F01DRAFT_1286475 [Mycena amicta]
MAEIVGASNTSLQSLMMFFMAAAVSLIPHQVLHYLGLAVVSSSMVLYGVHYNRPSVRLRRLNDYVKTTREILAHARRTCVRDHLELMVEDGRLLQVKLSTSNIQSQVLEARNVPWKVYFQTLGVVIRTIIDCEREVRQIQTATLLIIEAENRRQLRNVIAETREIVNAVAHASGPGG